MVFVRIAWSTICIGGGAWAATRMGELAESARWAGIFLPLAFIAILGILYAGHKAIDAAAAWKAKS